MIHYDLRCGGGHTFDGWFRSSVAFDQQAAAGLLECPVCAGTNVSRAIMAPRLSRGVAAPRQEAEQQAAQPTAPLAEAKSVSVPASAAGTDALSSGAALAGGPRTLPDEVRAVLQRLRAEVEQRCDYVGQRFADEARAMHHGEQPRRSIYGETTPEEAEMLADEGVEVARIPWVPRADG
jgi:hypothetical protein